MPKYQRSVGSDLMVLAIVSSFSTSIACNQHPLKMVELNQEIEGGESVPLDVNKDVDILFVIDDSFSMGEEQGLLAKNFANFIHVLERKEVDANYRIGIVSSDLGHEKCDDDVGLGGELRLESCTERLEDFIEPHRRIYRRNTACLNQCKRSASELEVRSTLVEGGGGEDDDDDNDPRLEKRPWIERIGGRTNLVHDDVPVADAFACFGPQGINGCGYESQLEAMHQALTLAQNSDSDQYGFLREGAILAVVFVTDEADCSSDPQYQNEAWSSTNKAFWPTEDSGVSSAVCWNAGVSCDGDRGGEYEQCVSQDHRADGTPISSENASSRESVLYPLSRYTELLDAIEAEKKKVDPDQEVIVALIGGVNGDGSVSYPKPKTGGSASEEESDFAHSFGVGWGCRGSVRIEEEMNDDLNMIEPSHEQAQYAVPPVRLLEFVNHYTEDPQSAMFSVCDGERYDDALEAIAKTIESQIQPACYRECPRNKNGSGSILEPQCIVTETIGVEERQLEECVFEGKGAEKSYAWNSETDSYVVPDGEDDCFAMLVDSTQDTADIHDDLSSQCIEDGFVLEFKVVRAEGKSSSRHAELTATCSISSLSDLDCPGMSK